VYGLGGIEQRYYDSNRDDLTTAFQQTIAKTAGVFTTDVSVTRVLFTVGGRMRHLSATGTVSTQYIIQAASDSAANDIISKVRASTSGTAAAAFKQDYVFHLQSLNGLAPLDPNSLSVSLATANGNNVVVDSSDDSSNDDTIIAVVVVLCVVVMAVIIAAVIVYTVSASSTSDQEYEKGSTSAQAPTDNYEPPKHKYTAEDNVFSTTEDEAAHPAAHEL
jgi:hypothetical protein